MDLQPGPDMLSELPLSIIHIILARVPIRDAVKTSILSRQWRDKWASLPHLKFDEEHYSIQGFNSRAKFDYWMEKFITNALLLHDGAITKFKLCVTFKSNYRHIDAWIRHLSRKGIRELIIKNYSDGTQELHSSIYSCKMLTKLRLLSCQLDPPPMTFKAFLFLRCLCLLQVYLSTNEVESLVANCPLLENFSSSCCGNSELRLSAPNLKVLQLQDYCIQMSLYAPLLAKLSVELLGNSVTANHQQQNSSVCNYIDFIGGFINLEKLHGDAYFTRYLSTGIESCHHTLVFHRLKEIDLFVHFEDIKSISVVARLIVGAPNLEKLELYEAYGRDIPRLPFDDFRCAPNFKLEKLRVVHLHMSYATGLPSEMGLVKFLLERSPVLETMSFGQLPSEEKRNLSVALEEWCNPASPNVKLEMAMGTPS